MTVAERVTWRKEAGEPEPTITVEYVLPVEVVSGDLTWGRGRCDALLDAVAQWTNDGESARQIGYRLGVTARTVSRLRVRCRESQRL
jgi:hypothetical protein